MEDWAQLISFDPGLVLKPATIDELKSMIEGNHQSGGRLRVPGSLH